MNPVENRAHGPYSFSHSRDWQRVGWISRRGGGGGGVADINV